MNNGNRDFLKGKSSNNCYSTSAVIHRSVDLSVTNSLPGSGILYNDKSAFRFHIKIICIMVLYNPDDRIMASVNSIVELVDRIYLVDNSLSPSPYLEELASDPIIGSNILLIENHENVGLGRALNTGVNKILADDSSSFILLLDQDSIVNKSVLREILFKLTTRWQDNIGIVGLSAKNRNRTSEPRFTRVDRHITSGSIINPKVFQKVRFREDFFVDMVDVEFCYEVRRLGYDILEYTEQALDHRLGLTKWKFNYEPHFRLYYMIRNSTVMLKERHLGILVFLKWNLLFSLASVIGNGPMSTASAIFYGVVDALSNRLGKCQRPLSM